MSVCSVAPLGGVFHFADKIEVALQMALKVSTTNGIPPFLAMEMMNATRDLEASGTDLVHLEIGQPSTPPPPAVLQTLSKSLGTTQTHGYSVAFGEMPLRRRIAAHYGDWYGRRPDPANIAVTLSYRGSQAAVNVQLQGHPLFSDDVTLQLDSLQALRLGLSFGQ